jgi:mevalonate kinase
MTVHTSACGKVILLGEHAVVYGVPAIAIGIERGVTATARPLDRGSSRLVVRAWNVDVTEEDDHDLGRALHAVREASGDGPSLSIEAEVDLPPGGGLGCSAALGVAVARAIDPRASSRAIASRVMAWERVFHGNPSGIDAAVAAGGGCISFTKGEGIEAVALGGPIHVCIGDTGIPASTKTMVQGVASLRERRPEVVEKALEGVRSLVRNARLAIEAGDSFALGRLMDLNQMILAGLFVSTQEVEELCSLARANGALGAKLTGAGGGGCVVALVRDEAGSETVLRAWRDAGFESFATRVAAGAESLKIAVGGSP